MTRPGARHSATANLPDEGPVTDLKLRLIDVWHGCSSLMMTQSTNGAGLKKNLGFLDFLKVFGLFRFYCTQCRTQIYDPRQVAYMKISVC